MDRSLSANNLIMLIWSSKANNTMKDVLMFQRKHIPLMLKEAIFKELQNFHLINAN